MPNIVKQPQGFFVVSDQGQPLAGPFATEFEAKDVSDYLYESIGRGPTSEYQALGSRIPYQEPQRTEFKGTPNPWGDLPTRQEQADFRGRTRGIPSGGWGNIPSNVGQQFQGFLSRVSDSPLSEYMETGKETFQRGMEALPGVWESAKGLLEPRTESGVGQDIKETFRTRRGTELIPVGKYNLESKSGKPPYGNTALLIPEAAEAFSEMNAAYKENKGKDLVLESAYRDYKHNKRVNGEETPGYHMEGVAIDATDADSRKWILENGEKFGFFFDDYEGSNHFNYGVQRDRDTERYSEKGRYWEENENR